MQTAIVLSGLDKYPSIKEALTVNQEGITEAQNDLVALNEKLAIAEEKISMAKELGLPLQGFTRHRNDMLRGIKRADARIKACESGYLEIPDFGDGRELEGMETDKYEWTFRLPGNVPLRVMQAIKEAKGNGCFEKILVHEPVRGRDPIISGKIGNLYFFITSYK